MTVENELLSTTQFIPIPEEEEQIEEFNCPVCYTDGSTSGLVSPANCTHPICLECYTNIATRSPSPTCPMCRSTYIRSVDATPTTVVTPVAQRFRPISPNMDSDLMSLLIHNTLPDYSLRNNIIIDTIANIERTQNILDLLSA